MRHCAFDYLEDCRTQCATLASIRGLPTGRRVATALYVRGEVGWELKSVKGLANREVDEKVKVAAVVAAAALATSGATGDVTDDDQLWICE